MQSDDEVTVVKPDKTKEELAAMKRREDTRKKNRKEQKNNELSVLCPLCKKVRILPTQLVCPAYDGLKDSPCPGWVRPRGTEEEQTKFLKCVNERTECLLRNVADFASHNVKQDDWEREKI